MPKPERPSAIPGEVGVQMLEHLRDLLNHMAWADGVFFHAWSKGPREDEELRERWSHVLGTATFFTEIIRGEHDLPWDKIKTGEVRPPWLDQPLKGFDELKSRTQANDEKLAATLATWDEAALEHKVLIPWFPDPPCVLSAAEAPYAGGAAHSAPPRPMHDQA